MTADSEQEFSYYTVGKVRDFTEGKMRSAKVGLIDIAVLRLEDGWRAFSNYCTHVGAPLSAGWISGGQVVCVFHNACFDYTTGAVVSGPGYTTLPVFSIQVEGDDVRVALPAPADGSVPQVKLAPLPA